MLKYYLPNIKPGKFYSTQTFIFPSGKHTLNVINSNTGYTVIRDEYDIDLYTANGMITGLNKKRIKSDFMIHFEFIKFCVDNNVDFYPYWVMAIDRLIRFYGFNVKEAIEYQLNREREELYKEINLKTISMFPALVNTRGQ